MQFSSISLFSSYHDLVIQITTVLSIFFGIYTIISKNPIVSFLFLIGLFSSVSLYLIWSGLYFIGLSYLLVYIGAISILFIFILMLINIRVSELLTDNRNSVALGVLVVLFFNFSIYSILPKNIYFGTKQTQDLTWDSVLAPVSHISLISDVLYTDLAMSFIILSLILLLSMMGAIMITISRSGLNEKNDNRSTDSLYHISSSL